MAPHKIPLTDDGCKLVTRPALREILGCSEDAAGKFIELHQSAFIDLNPGGERRNWTIPRARLDRILLGDTDPIEDALANPGPKKRTVRKPRKQHV